MFFFFKGGTIFEHLSQSTKEVVYYPFFFLSSL